jgi:hypothetical protein
MTRHNKDNDLCSPVEQVQHFSLLRRDVKYNCSNDSSIKLRFDIKQSTGQLNEC